MCLDLIETAPRREANCSLITHLSFKAQKRLFKAIATEAAPQTKSAENAFLSLFVASCPFVFHCRRKAISAFFRFSPNGAYAICSLSSVCLMWMCVVHNELACNDRRCAGHWLRAEIARCAPASHPHNVSSRTLRALFTFVWSNDTLASQNNTHEHKSPPPKRSMHMPRSRYVPHEIVRQNSKSQSKNRSSKLVFWLFVCLCFVCERIYTYFLLHQNLYVVLFAKPKQITLVRFCSSISDWIRVIC